LSAKQLLGNSDAADPRALLTGVLRSAVELLSLPDNDFAWSSWENRDAAVAKVQSMLGLLERGELPYDSIAIQNLINRSGLEHFENHAVRWI
jgi:hypothetical protein